MITTENVTIYKCEFCKKKYFRKHACEGHEKYCSSNPENEKACSGCVFLEETKVEYDVDNYEYGGYQTRYSNGFKCLKKDQLLYPLKAERLDLPNRYPETFEDQLPMPKDCDLRDDGYVGIKDLWD